jgi:hypothetical protein
MSDAGLGACRRSSPIWPGNNYGRRSPTKLYNCPADEITLDEVESAHLTKGTLHKGLLRETSTRTLLDDDIGIWTMTHVEEESLGREYGDAYREFQSRVPRLFPRPSVLGRKSVVER